MPAIAPFVPLIAAGVSAGAGIYAGNKASKQNAQIQQGMAQTQAQQMGLFNQAQQMFPMMQGLAGQYGQGAQGFLGDRGALGQLQGHYAPLMDQMQRLYAQDAQGGAMSQMQELARQGGADDAGASQRLLGLADQAIWATGGDVYRQQARLAGQDALGQMSSGLAGRGILGSGTAQRVGASTLARLYADAGARQQQDQMQARSLAASATGQAGQLALARGQQQAGLLGQLANMGLAGQQQRAGLLGQMGGLLGQQQQGILAQSGLLGNYLQGLQGQYGMLQGIAGLYNQQAGALGGMWQQQASQVNPNPYGGLAAGLGALGNAGAQYMNWRAKGLMGPQVMPSTGQGMPGFGVRYANTLP